MRAHWSIYAILLAIGSPASGQTLLTGHGSGTVVRLSGVGFRGAPLLDGFYFRFGPRLGLPSNTDHHFTYIEAGADRPWFNRVTAALGDDDRPAPHPFAYALSFHPRYGLTSVGSTPPLIGIGEINVPLERPDRSSVFLLRGFRLEFVEDNHHLQRIAIVENAGVLTIALEAGPQGLFLDDTSFRSQVDYAYIPRRLVQRRSTTRGSKGSGGADQAETQRGQSVLVGFDMRFTNEAHHVREIGVWTPDDGRVQVFFNDKNSDDPFEWEVQWAILKRDPRTGIDRPGPGGDRPDRPTIDPGDVPSTATDHSHAIVVPLR